VQALAKHASSLCQKQWAFILEQHGAMAKLKYSPLCTVPAATKAMSEFHPAWDRLVFSLTKPDVLSLKKGLSGLNTAKTALSGLCMPKGVKRKNVDC
jgi:hypothetical protein